MAQTDIWFPFYISDYLRDTQMLLTVEHGAYLLLLCAFWIGKGEMDDDDRSFAAICKCTVEEWRTQLRPRLQHFFQVSNGKWLHKRVLYERKRADSISEIRSKVGKLGGRPKTNSLAIAYPNRKANEKQNETHSQSQSHQKGGRENGAARRPLFSGNGHSENNGLPRDEAIRREKELDRVEKAIDRLRQDKENWIQADKDKLKQLKERRQQLLDLLGMAA